MQHSEEEAWNALVNKIHDFYRGHLFFRYPQPGSRNKSWRPSWKQIMTDVLPPSLSDHESGGWNGTVLCTRSHGMSVFTRHRFPPGVDWCNGPCIDSGYVRGLSKGSLEGKFRQGELVIEDNMGARHIFKIVADHQYPIPEDSYSLIGTDPFYDLKRIFVKQCWVIGKKLPGQMFKKVSVFQIPDSHEVQRLNGLCIAVNASTILA
ncbi:hypothetical protein EV421DRAFT_1741313 [Armillaria borealis]|uniref:Uncharacterized protein n=1 Tax=Armillaria borealis TaxID=47425 RepID=A0AA39MH83_9AGAR|nr:hypothetical protein EV421DRAFT_1741313 [Armillaria borealis]